MNETGPSLEDLRDARANLAISIADEIRAFENRYGVTVDSVNLESVTEVGHHGAQKRLAAVRVSLTL